MSHESFPSTLGGSCGFSRGLSSGMALGLRSFRLVHPAICNSLVAFSRPVSEVPLKAAAGRQNDYRQYLVSLALPSRHFATKKAKAKGKGQSQTRVSLNTALVGDIINLEEVDEEMKSVIEALKDNFNKTVNIRTSPVTDIFGLIFSNLSYLAILIPYWEPPAHLKFDQEDSIWVNNFLKVAFLSGKCQNCLGELFADVMEEIEASVVNGLLLIMTLNPVEYFTSDLWAVLFVSQNEPPQVVSAVHGSLDQISVVTADGKLALNQIGQISMKSPQLILVNMASFPECTAAAIKAIRESGMNLNPEVEGTLIRVPIPKTPRHGAGTVLQSVFREDVAVSALRAPAVPDPVCICADIFTIVSNRVTREHREMLVKLAKQNTNKAKESLRKVRTNAMNKLKKSKDKVSEDTIRLIEKQRRLGPSFLAVRGCQPAGAGVLLGTMPHPMQATMWVGAGEAAEGLGWRVRRATEPAPFCALAPEELCFPAEKCVAVAMISQMADDTVAELDRHLAVKTKELLG
ncbi:Ribosome-recycling factor, mitochondrial [Galemys pyrenaicus]|uniref:Ribosome-recycling factor, mitochondrial n=1 Tax=Galemys pyrenaicus TaxID=202257 RepID=A0A8J6B1J4_GALPY|nr:Ribosome-recycling factor, mitochondrial [Galemys pyrenaicus]